MNRLLRSGMRHSPDLLRDKRRSAELRAKYGYFRHIWLAERPRAATVPVQWQVLLLSTWPSGIRQSLAHGLDRVLRAIEQVMYLTGADRVGDSERMQEAPRKPAKTGAPFALVVGGQAAPRAEKFARALGEDLESWLTVHAAPVSQQLERAAKAIRAWRPPGWAVPSAGQPTVAIRAVASTRPSSALQRPNRPSRRGSAREVA